MNDGHFDSDNDAAIFSDLVNGGHSAKYNDAAIFSDLVNGGHSASENGAVIFSDLANGRNSASDCDAAIVSDNSVNGDYVMINDDVEDVVEDRYDIESYSDVSDDGFSTDDSLNVSDIEDESSVIIIDSDDDTAIVPSTLMTRTQTFVFSFRRET